MEKIVKYAQKKREFCWEKTIYICSTLWWFMLNKLLNTCSYLLKNVLQKKAGVDLIIVGYKKRTKLEKTRV